MSSEQHKNQILKEKEAAAYIGMSVSYLQHARCYGASGNRTSGPSYLKMGRSVRYRLKDLDSWIERQTMKH